MICYFSTKSKNTSRFVAKLEATNRLQLSAEPVLITEPFLLLVGTYANHEGKNAVPKQVIDFLKLNYKNLIGVVSSGNRNFGSLFAISGDIISRNCNVPLLHKYELAGTPADVDIVNNLYTTRMQHVRC